MLFYTILLWVFRVRPFGNIEQLQGRLLVTLSG